MTTHISVIRGVNTPTELHGTLTPRKCVFHVFNVPFGHRKPFPKALDVTERFVRVTSYRCDRVQGRKAGRTLQLVMVTFLSHVLMELRSMLFPA